MRVFQFCVPNGADTPLCALHEYIYIMLLKWVVCRIMLLDIIQCRFFNCFSVHIFIR